MKFGRRVSGYVTCGPTKKNKDATATLTMPITAQTKRSWKILRRQIDVAAFSGGQRHFGSMLGTDGVHGDHFTFGRTKPVGGTHRPQHGIVNIQTLGSDADDLACLEATVGARDGVKDA